MVDLVNSTKVAQFVMVTVWELPLILEGDGTSDLISRQPVYKIEHLKFAEVRMDLTLPHPQSFNRPD